LPFNAYKHVTNTCSNNGGDAITEKTMEHWKTSRPREELQLFDMEKFLTLRAFNEKGELYLCHVVIIV